MLYGLDTAYAPTMSAARTQFEYGWRFYGGYLGGPRAMNAWSHDDFARLAEVGFVFLPIYVGRTAPWDGAEAFTYTNGRNDGFQACGLAGDCGFSESMPLVLDAEYGDWQQQPEAFTEYLRGWVEVVNAVGHPAVLYSDMETLAQFDRSMVDFTWGAAWQPSAFSPRPPIGRYNPASPPPWDLWQYYGGSGTIAGVNVDLNSATDTCPFAEFAAA